jgi:hypothetical protein
MLYGKKMKLWSFSFHCHCKIQILLMIVIASITMKIEKTNIHSRFREVWYVPRPPSGHCQWQRVENNSLQQNKDDFNFHIVNFPFICSKSISTCTWRIFLSVYARFYCIPVFPIEISFKWGCCEKGGYWNISLYWWIWSYQFDRFSVALMT